MKCNKCGTEYEGNFCPNGCNSPQVPQANVKKPIYKKWWFWLVLIILGLVLIVSVGGNNGGKKVDWDDLVLGEYLPAISSAKGEIYSNDTEDLNVEIQKYTIKQYTAYINACKEFGYITDAQTDSNSYSAYNNDGYKLEITYYEYGEELHIQLEAPIELSTIIWPNSAAGKQLPTPKSKSGNFSYERDDGFHVYIGNMTKNDYNEYVNLCSAKGFNIDYDKGDNSYNAKNKAGWKLYLRYEGNNIISISIDAPEDTNTIENNENIDSDTSDNITNDSSDDKAENNKEPQEESNSSDTGLSADFKTAMDNYEKFMDDYIAFMKKYKENPSDLSLISDYAKFMSQYNDTVKSFEKWETEDLNDEETSYYIDVQTRVNKKLLEIAG